MAANISDIPDLKALFSAVYVNNLDAVKRILAAQSVPPEHYNELLRNALYFQFFDIATQLILFGADVNYQDPSLGSLIENYYKDKDKETVSFLIKNTALVKKEYIQNLFYNESFEILRILVAAGIDLNISVTAFTDKGAVQIEFIRECIGMRKFALLKFLLREGGIKLELSEPLILYCETPAFDEEMARCLLEAGWDINSVGNQKKPALFSALHYHRNDMLRFLLRHGADVNLKAICATGCKHSALEIALEIKNYEAVEQLLSRSDINILSVPKRIYKDLAQEKTLVSKKILKQLHDVINKRLETKEGQDELTLEEIVNIPFSVYKNNPALENIIRNRLKYLLLDNPIFAKFQTILTKNPSLLLKNMSLLGVIAELSFILLHPEKINQHETMLCGPASFLSIMMHQSPERVIDLALVLALQGKTEKPFCLTLSKYSLQQATSMIEILLVEIRRQANWTGYSPSSFREGFQGLTAPKTLCGWLEVAGFNNIEELITPSNVRGKALSHPSEMLLNIVFCKFHQKRRSKLTKEANLEYATKSLAAKKQAIMLVSPQWVESLESDVSKAHPVSEKPTATSLCGIAIDHYVYLVELKSLEENVYYKFETWGTTYEGTIARKEFLMHYRGVILADSLDSGLKPKITRELCHASDHNDGETKAAKETMQARAEPAAPAAPTLIFRGRTTERLEDGRHASQEARNIVGLR